MPYGPRQSRVATPSGSATELGSDFLLPVFTSWYLNNSLKECPGVLLSDRAEHIQHKTSTYLAVTCNDEGTILQLLSG